MININDLLSYSNIIIQCHDHPDPDAIASAFALYKYLNMPGKKVEIVYSGPKEIQKPNVKLLIIKLNIPIRYIKNDDTAPIFNNYEEGILILVDCQYGEGNVKKLQADNIAIIDHHPIMKKILPRPLFIDIRPLYGSCSTIIWDLLRKAGFDFNKNLDVGTALFYGLFSDTGNLSEISHPSDKDLRDSIKYDIDLINLLKNSILSLKELKITAKTLINYKIFSNIKCAIFKSETRDRNILGFICDFALQVENIDICIVFFCEGKIMRLSVRSCIREVMPNELADRLCENVGSGGGHPYKAGGYIELDKLEKRKISDLFKFLKDRLERYFKEYDYINCKSLNININELGKYCKKPIPIGYIRSEEIFNKGTELMIRSIEGDTNITAGPDIYIMIGIEQEVYPIKREKYKASYLESDISYVFDENLHKEGYIPVIKDRTLDEEKPINSIIKNIHSCVPKGEKIYAKQLDRKTKVFTDWNLEGYMTGSIGDYLAIRTDDSKDAYVITKAIFEKTYEKVE